MYYKILIRAKIKWNFFHCTHIEIAEIMAYKAATVVSTLLARCRDRFRQRITAVLTHREEIDLDPGREYLEDILDDLDARDGLA